MGSTVMKGIAVVAAIAGLSFVVWYTIDVWKDPRLRARPAAEVTERLTNSIGLLLEGLNLIEKKRSVGAGADRLKEGTFQVSNWLSETRKLRPANQEKVFEAIQGPLAELDAETARLLWSPDVGAELWPTMNRIITAIGRNSSFTMPLSRLSGEMMEACDGLAGALGEVKGDDAAVKAALEQVRAIDGRLSGVQELKESLPEEDRATLRSLAGPRLKKLTKLAEEKLAKPWAREALQGPVEDVLRKLKGLAAG